MSLSLLLYIGFGLFVLILLVSAVRSFAPQSHGSFQSFAPVGKRLSRTDALSEKQKRLLTFSLLPSYLRAEPLLVLKQPGRHSARSKATLAEEWGLDDRDAILAQLDYLLSGARSTSLDTELMEGSELALSSRRAVASALLLSPSCLDAINSTYAWDCGEAAELAKLAYSADFLSEQELWNYLEQISDNAQRFGRDWYEYTLSYLLGRTMQGESLALIKERAYTLFHLPKDALVQEPNLNAYSRYRFTINKDGTGMCIDSH